MQCPRCQHENPAGQKFCGECGARLASACPSCGASNSPARKFCGECGMALTQADAPTKYGTPQSYTPKYLAEKILTSKAALEGERKQVTVLFADIKGSMELLADRDPEEARKLLDPVLEQMMEAVHRYEGTVNQVMGDGIMALFGAPLAHEDHAVRASYAALDMQAAMSRYAEEVRHSFGIEIQIRIGLNSGEVVVRAIGNDLRMDYTAVGQTTHLAARMEQLARPGTTRLTAQTLGLAEGYIEVKTLGPVPIKGVNAPVEVFELLSASSGRSRLHTAAARGLTQFVGRDAELEQLRLALGLALTGQGQVVAIVGEPGVGKSRLVWEATHSHRTHGWLIVQAGAASYGRLTPYVPIMELLKGYFRIHHEDDDRDVREKVIGKLLALDEALKPTLPAFLGLLDVPVEDPTWIALDPPQRRQRTIEAVTRLLLRESHVHPVLVVLEGLHWIDTETQSLLDSLVESLPTSRLLLLVNYRPEYQHNWAGKTYYRQLLLDCLSPKTVDGLLALLLGTSLALEPLKQALIERTEGNPLFLEESIRTLIETKILSGERGGYRLEKPGESVEIPPTIHSILSARIDRLPLEEKTLLQTASVIGKDVPHALLQQVVGLQEEDLHRHLAHLQAADLLYESARVPELTYTFKHVLTQDVAYGCLLQTQRRRLHARIADAIESFDPDRLSLHGDRLAHHAFLGGLWAQAVAYLGQAGDRALAVAAYGPAVSLFERALTALQHLPEGPETRTQAVDLHLKTRHALQLLGDLGRCGQHLEEAERLAEAGDDQRQLARVHSLVAQQFRLSGDLPRAVASGERASGIAERLDDPALRVLANSVLGTVYMSRGHYQKAAEVLKACAEPSGTLPSPDRSIEGLIPIFWRLNLVSCLAQLGDFSEAMRHADVVLRLAESADYGYGIMLACWGSGILSLLKGDVAQAVVLLERTLDLARSLSVRLAIPPLASSLGAAYSLSGRPRDAISLLEEGVREGVSMKRPEGHSLLLVRLAEAYLLVGRIEDATPTARQALRLAREKDERGHEAYAMHMLGEIASCEAPANMMAAESSYYHGLALAEEFSMRPLVTHCHLGLGKLYRRTGQPEQAREHLTVATTMYREMDMRFWLEQVEAEMKGLA